MTLAAQLRPRRIPQVRTVRVRVRGGYQPSLLHGRVGEPLRIVFFREESSACSEHVVFPAFGRSAMLPPFQDVTLELVPERAGEYEFTCQLGVLRGRLVVVADEAVPDPPPAEPAPSEHKDPALLAFVVWACSLPLLLLVAVPFLGWRAGGLLALFWLGVVAAACFAVCVHGVGRRRSRGPAGGRAAHRPGHRPAP